MQQTKITPKGQTTIPRKVRTFLGVAPGKAIEWHVVRGMVMVDAAKQMKEPVKFLTNQVTLDLDMVKMVKDIREER